MGTFQIQTITEGEEVREERRGEEGREGTMEEREGSRGEVRRGDVERRWGDQKRKAGIRATGCRVTEKEQCSGNQGKEERGVQCCRCWVVKCTRAWSPERFKW